MKRYFYKNCISFRKTNEEYGALSNMAKGFPLVINNHTILTSEALYQACKFPNNPDIQQDIISQKSPMAAKMKAKPFRKEIRSDWLDIRVQIMRWCIGVKLFQHREVFGKILLSTYNFDIVEDSRKDVFWGAKLDGEYFIGNNMLGRLLMELRAFWEKNHNKKINEYLFPPNISNFLLFSEPIQKVHYIKELDIDATPNTMLSLL